MLPTLRKSWTWSLSLSSSQFSILDIQPRFILLTVSSLLTIERPLRRSSSVLEFAISILTASLVAFRPLIKYLPFGSHGRSSGGRAGSGEQGSGRTNDFELGRHAAKAIRLDGDDAESQRNILQDEGGNGVWTRSRSTVTYTGAGEGSYESQKNGPEKGLT